MMGHRRLSIIDLSEKASQPFVDKKSGDRLVFNGEIYNYIEVKRDLEKRGYEFETQSDTEVLLYALREWGFAALEEF